MSRARRLIVTLIASLVAAAGTLGNARAASLMDPALRFRTLTTAHFSIHFHQGEDRLAQRLAAIAEDAWRALPRPLGLSLPAHTHVVLADQTELANGFATPLPYNTIVIAAAWPAGSEFIGRTDDWLRLAFTHEFTHIAHLDRSKGWAGLVRHLFGRTPIAFPNLFLPAWQIEGLATFEESATGDGRLHAGDFQAVVHEAARAGRFDPLGRVNGGLIDWPGGTAQYAYGAGFHAYLAERYGDASLAQLVEETAGRVPYTTAPVFKRVFGRRLGELWRDYQAGVTSGLAAGAPGDPSAVVSRRLTHHGFVVEGPRYDRGRCNGCVIYSVRTPHEFPALYELPADGGAPRHLTRRYLGSTAAIARDTIYFDQQELRRNSGLYADVYALDRASGRVTALTSEARVRDPDVSPDGQTLVAVKDLADRRELVLVALDRPRRAVVTTLLSEADVQFNAPRWSPDGRSIAVERHAAGSLSAIALVSLETGAVRTVTPAVRARFVTPAWRPDGRALVVAADLDEGPFNLYELAIADAPASSLRPLTHTTGGAIWPDVSADGRRIVFAGYTADGFDLFEVTYAPSADDVRLESDATETETAVRSVPYADDVRLKPDATAATSQVPSAVASESPSAVASDFSRTSMIPAPPSSVASAFRLRQRLRRTTVASAEVVSRTSSYNPLQSLRPTSWSPIIDSDNRQLRFGFATGGVDVLGYHGYGVSATWLANSPAEAAGTNRSAPDWRLAYVYDRWRPAFWVAGSSDTSFAAGPADARGTPSTATLRETQIEAGVLLPIAHVRAAQQFVTAIVRGVDELTVAAAVSDRNKTAWRAGWSINSAHRYGYSISPEEGAAFGATLELSRRALGASADASVFTADARFYLSPFARHHVLAMRAAGGLSTGDATLGRTFHLGGAQSNPDLLDFGRQAVSLLRGFGSDTFGGSRVALANVDYRWPIARPQWGSGTWPFFLRTVHAAVFGDAGHAWSRAFRARDLKTSLGGELSLDFVAGYAFPFTATIGAAWGRDGSRTVANGGTIYVRVGRAF